MFRGPCPSHVAALCLALLGGLLAVPGATVTAAITGLAPTVSVAVTPTRPEAGKPLVVALTVPGDAGAIEGRLLFRASAADFVGVAPLGGGTALFPEPIGDGVAFAAYGLQEHAGHTVVRLILEPRTTGQLQIRILVDSLADAAGRRLALGSGDQLATIPVGRASSAWPAPDTSYHPIASRAATPARDLVGNGRIDGQDLAEVRGDVLAAERTGTTCSDDGPGDANGDGCVDAVDLQAIYAALGARVPVGSGADAVTTGTVAHTFTVTSAADTPDAKPGDGLCADAEGGCTLRAAMTEANYLAGDDRIEFDIPGPAPVTIQIGSRLPYIATLNGTLTIDGYTEPGAQVNTSAVGSNAVPGIEIRGNGLSAGEVGLYITSMGNVIRGLVIDNIYRAIMVDGSDAHDNVIEGNWLGFTRTGGKPASTGSYGILLNTGANHNLIGTPDLADRNVLGFWQKAVDSYGPGTDDNTIQDNQLCIGPSGFTAATCGTGIDHDFGPKDELAGGTGTNERNIIGPTTRQGIEYSHGWNPNDKSDPADTWQITGNRAIGNWVGFRGDGSYRAAYRSGQKFSSIDNDQGINCYDGTYDNTIEGNVIASVYDGIQIMAPNAKHNVVRGNIIGVSPLGEPAPLTGWGVKLRWATTYDTIVGNTIRYAARGGIGLVNTDNTGAPQVVASHITISQNIITNTKGPAIYLAPLQGYPRSGANALLPAPRVTAATTARVKGNGVRGATVEVYRATRAAGASGLPSAYLGSAKVARDGTWTLAVRGLKAGDRVAALQIQSNGNTSELGINVTVRAARPGAGT